MPKGTGKDSHSGRERYPLGGSTMELIYPGKIRRRKVADETMLGGRRSSSDNSDVLSKTMLSSMAKALLDAMTPDEKLKLIRKRNVGRNEGRR